MHEGPDETLPPEESGTGEKPGPGSLDEDDPKTTDDGSGTSETD